MQIQAHFHESFSAFFYGTLMHPNVLRRVIQSDGSHLQICPAVLKSYVRHHVKHASFPAVVSYEQSAQLTDEIIPESERCVNGVVVCGLSSQDIKLLDYFESRMYRRVLLPVYPLRDFVPLDTALDDDDFRVSTHGDTPNFGTPVEVTVYIWDNPISDLSPEIWSYESFIKDKLAVWL